MARVAGCCPTSKSGMKRTEVNAVWGYHANGHAAGGLRCAELFFFVNTLNEDKILSRQKNDWNLSNAVVEN